jgi:hypothetical protein
MELIDEIRYRAQQISPLVLFPCASFLHARLLTHLDELGSSNGRHQYMSEMPIGAHVIHV